MKTIITIRRYSLSWGTGFKMTGITVFTLDPSHSNTDKTIRGYNEWKNYYCIRRT